MPTRDTPSGSTRRGLTQSLTSRLAALAQRFLNKVSQPGQGVTYALLLEMAQCDPELFEITAEFARYKTMVGQ